MNVGDTVKIVKCVECPAIVGKTAKVKAVDDQEVSLNYGRGQPQANRPSELSRDDVSLVGGE